MAGSGCLFAGWDPLIDEIMPAVLLWKEHGWL